MSGGWTLDQMPDLTGRRALVTGATSGIGRQTATELARHGAEVVLAARSLDRLAATEKSVLAEVPTARLHRVVVDLTDLGSVRLAAADAARLGPLHLLVNNAGVMATPYQRTVDGFERQLATNHLGPFLLTGLLLPSLVASEDGRVLTVSSQMHRLTRSMPLDDPRVPERRYSPWLAYSRSKLANLLFTFELDRRAREAGLPVKALAAHPGYSATDLWVNRGQRQGTGRILEAAFGVAGQPPALGALPTLMAATADLPGATYVGPGNVLQLRGLPKVVAARRMAHDRDLQRRLWEISEEVTGISYP